MGQEYRRTTTTVSLINYHFVFCPRYRRKVLVKDVDRRFREILQEICDEHELIIVALEVMPDHVQLFVNALPSLSPSDIMAKVKGVTSRKLKTNRWYKLLPSQTAQEVLAELDDSYRSWYSHRKNGDLLAKPPGFRKKATLSTLTFKQNAFGMPGENKVLLKLPKTYDRQAVTLEYKLPPDAKLGKVQQVKLTYEHKSGDWYLLIYHKVKIEYLPLQNIMALDLGIINIVTGYLSNGKSFVIPGGELLALDRYFHKMKAKTNSSKSRKCRDLNRKWSRQRNHYLHVLTKNIVDKAVTNNVSQILVGELKGIRENKDWGAKHNQELHAWPYRKIIQMLRYKAALKGILVEEVSECYTSTTCPVCGRRAKSARVERGLFVHCNRAFNADVVGAFNILGRSLQDNGLPLLEVVGALARPVVNLFVWRKATPKGREQGTFKVA